MGFFFFLFTLLIVALRSDAHWKVSIVTTILSVNISKTHLAIFSYWSTFSSVSGVVEFRLPRHKELPNLDLRNQKEFCSHSSLHLRTQLPACWHLFPWVTNTVEMAQRREQWQRTDRLQPFACSYQHTGHTHHSKKLPWAVPWWCGPVDDRIPGEWLLWGRPELACRTRTVNSED